MEIDRLLVVKLAIYADDLLSFIASEDEDPEIRWRVCRALEEAVKAVNAELAKCVKCGGTKMHIDGDPCPDCDGTGKCKET